MAIIIELFCPECHGRKLVSRSWDTKIECRSCEKVYEEFELRQECTELVCLAETQRVCNDFADSFRILMRHMFNPFTGECYAQF